MQPMYDIGPDVRKRTYLFEQVLAGIDSKSTDCSLTMELRRRVDAPKIEGWRIDWQATIRPERVSRERNADTAGDLPRCFHHVQTEFPPTAAWACEPEPCPSKCGVVVVSEAIK